MTPFLRRALLALAVALALWSGLAAASWVAWGTPAALLGFAVAFFAASHWPGAVVRQ